MRDLVGGIVFLAVGGLTLYLARGLPLGQVRLPGPGALPTIAGVAITLLSLLLAWRGMKSLRAVTRSDGPAPDWQGYSRIAAVAALIAVYTAVISWLGFFVSTALLMTVLFMLGVERPMRWGPPAAGLAATAAAYVLFVTLLDVRLPVGSLWGG
jgi:hypothetical protein